MTNLKKLLIASLIAISIIIIGIIVWVFKSKNKENEVTDPKIIELRSNYGDEYTDDELLYIENISQGKKYFDFILLAMQKGNDWKYYPIHKTLKEKYSGKDGLLYEYDFDTIEYTQNTLNDIDYTDAKSAYVEVILTKGKEKRFLRIEVLGESCLDSFRILEDYLIQDSTGTPIELRLATYPVAIR